MGADDRSKGDGFQMEKRKGDMAGDVRNEELLAKSITIDGRKEWYCRFCSERNVWTRPECRRCKTSIPSVLQGKDMQAVSTRRRVVAAGLSRPPQAMVRDKVLAYEAQWAEEKELRELREENQRLKNEGEKPSVQFEEASEEVMREEDEKMEKGGGLDSKKN